MHHLSCLSIDKDYNSENIYINIVECGKNLTNFGHMDSIKPMNSKTKSKN